MFQQTSQSLMLRFGLVMAAISLLAILSATGSLMMANRIEGQAESVNLSGSLRMQSYRIATQLVYDNSIDETDYRNNLNGMVAGFERKLNALARELENKGARLNNAYGRVSTQWRARIRPLLDTYVSGLAEGDPISGDARTVIRARYLDQVPDFVRNIDDFVELLAQDAESRVQRLLLYQYSLLALTLMMVAAALVLAHYRIRAPLATLLQLAKRTGQGDFSGQTPYAGADELGQLGRAFNLMSRDLRQLYQDLERRVKRKTADLERSRRSVELMYRTVNHLRDAANRPIDYDSLLNDIEALAETGPGTICLADKVEAGAKMLASTFDHHRWESGCAVNNCNDCLNHEQTAVVRFREPRDGDCHMIATPIRHGATQYGVLLTQMPAGKPLESWQQRLLQAVADHIGIALNQSHRAAERRRLGLLEERAIIARELHDSLAQALAYLKIQVARLEKNQLAGDDRAATRSIIHELRQGLTDAYRELRELLSTFRLRMDDEDLETALEKTVNEFRERASVDIRLDYRVRHNELGVNEEIHLLQIVREALTNVVNHARATECVVAFTPGDDEQLTLSIDDNGQGFPRDPEKLFHYGLIIMRERAASLQGELQLGPSPLGGASVSVRFTPERHRKQQPQVVMAAT